MSAASRNRLRRGAFVVLMLALTVLFGALGSWQMARLAEKEALIATVAERMDEPPLQLPPADGWPELDAADFDYLPLTVTGRFVPGVTVPVFTSLGEPRGERGGPGYWLMTPFALDAGGTVFVNRGFIPQAELSNLAGFGPAAAGGSPMTLEGVGRVAERANAFTPAADRANRIEWVRDPVRLAELAGIEGPVAPIYVDVPAGPAGVLPQGGETVVEFPNNHLGYAITWFGFAILTPILLVFWLRRRAP